MTKVAVIVLSVFFANYSLANSDLPCQKLDAATEGLSQRNTWIPTSGVLTLTQATALLNDYYSTWNRGAFNSQVLANAGKPFPQKEDVDNIVGLYTTDTVITHRDLGVGKLPNMVMRGEDQTRNQFATFFLQRQPGSIHKAEYICVQGNAVTVGLRYFAPKKGKFLNPKNPALDRDLAVSIFLIGNYVIENKRVKTLEIPYDFTWFGVQSVVGGIPLTP